MWIFKLEGKKKEKGSSGDFRIVLSFNYFSVIQTYVFICLFSSLHAYIHSFIPLCFFWSPLLAIFFHFQILFIGPGSCVCFRLTSAPAMVLIFGLPCSSATWTPSWAHLAFLPLFSFHSFQVEKLTLPPVNLAKSSFLEQRLKSREFNGIITREGSEFFKLSPGC